MPDRDSSLPVPSDEEKMWAAVAHGGTLIGFAMIAPLVVWVVQKDKSAFVAFHAKQALIFQVVAFVAILFIGLVTCGIGTLLLFPFYFVELWYTYLAFQGKWQGYPGLPGPGV